MYKIKRMTEEHIDDVAEIEKECFTIAWTIENKALEQHLWRHLLIWQNGWR